MTFVSPLKCLGFKCLNVILKVVSKTRFNTTYFYCTFSYPAQAREYTLACVKVPNDVSEFFVLTLTFD